MLINCNQNVFLSLLLQILIFMKKFNSISFQIILDFLVTLNDYHELISLKTIPGENSKKYKVFKISYLKSDGDSMLLRIELDYKKNKLSYTTWGFSEFQTIKFESFTIYHISSIEVI